MMNTGGNWFPIDFAAFCGYELPELWPMEWEFPTDARLLAPVAR